MNRPAFGPAYLVAVALAGAPLAAPPAVAAQSPASLATPRTSASGVQRKSAAKTLGRSVTVNGGANRPVSAAQCTSRAATMPTTTGGATGTLGPNGPSQSQTIVAVPIGSGDVATATRQQQIAEACAHVRH